MARRRSRAAKRGPKNQVWTTIVNSSVTVLAGATKTGTDIVTSADWINIGGAERGTVLRVRGWFSAALLVPTVQFVGGGAFAYVGVYDEDELSKDASLASTYAEEDIMGTWGHEYAASEVDDSIREWNEVVDIKAMRKIQTGQDLRFVATNNTALIMQISLVLRALVRRGGN